MIRRCGRRELRQADKRGSCLLYICYSPVGFCRIPWPLCDDTEADFDIHPRLYENGHIHCNANGTRVVWDDVSGRWRCFVDFFPSKRLPGDPSPPIVLYCKIFRTPSSCFSRRKFYSQTPDLAVLPRGSRHADPKNTSRPNLQSTTEHPSIRRNALIDDQPSDSRHSNDGEDIGGPCSAIVDGNTTSPQTEFHREFHRVGIPLKGQSGLRSYHQSEDEFDAMLS